VSIIAVAGGTGFVGQALVKALLKKNIKVLIISRDESKVRACFADKVGFLAWDASDDQIISKFKGCQTIVNLAGENISAQRWSKAFKGLLISSRINAAKRLAYYCSLLAHKPRLFVASAVSVYGIYSQIQKIYTEQDNTQKNSFLSELALSLESAYADFSARGVSVHFLRLGLVMAPSGGVLKQLLLPTKLCLGAVMGSGNQPWSWIGREDLIRAILFLLEKDKLKPSYNCVNESSATQKEVVNMLAHALNRPRLLAVPAFMLRTILGPTMATELLLSGTGAIPENLISAGFVFHQSSLAEVI
jgi:uncharacterized protein (TIGR01777 family)